METLCQKCWQRSLPPPHWTGLRWSEQAGLVEPTLRKVYIRWKDLFAWQIHGGVAGVGGLAAETFGTIVAVCRYTVRDAVPLAFRQLGTAMYLHRAIPDFFDQLDFAERTVATLAVRG